jgi:glycine/D-amino acid oxidase-like deaminating enzyme
MIIGGGIVGAGVAAGLSGHSEIDVTVIERGPAERLLGSTGHAPGFVSELSETPVLTEMAVASTELYSGLETGASGFDRVGGLEVAVSDSALANLERRAGLAADLGIEARMLEPAEALALAPPFIDRDTCLGGLLMPGDGAARGGVLTGALTALAVRRGAQVRFDTACTAIIQRGGRVTGVHTADGERLAADDVVIAAGIWGSEIAALAGIEVHFTSVAHPYVYGPAREHLGAARLPFVKWRSETVYARDHGDRFGIGTHTNDGPAVDASALGEAELPWPDQEFEGEIEAAMLLLPKAFRFPVERRLNGLFSMTADGLPLLGSSRSVDGLWVAVSLWLTHAGGAARALVEMMTGQEPFAQGLDAMLPERFAGRDQDQLTAAALSNYRRIWMPAEQPAER